MPTSKSNTISIIGPGRLGTAVGVCAQRAGYQVVALGARDLAKAELAARRIGGQPRVCTIEEAAAQADLVLLTVSDDAIESVARDLVRARVLQNETKLIHCSGALSSEVIAVARQCGCHVGSAHPMQTFSDVDNAARKLSGIYWFCEGDPQAVSAIVNLCADLRGITIRITAEQKTKCHIAAVFACNYLVTLMDIAMALAESAKIDRKVAWAAFTPMVEATLENIHELGPREALSGPIRRGDSATVARHLSILAGEDKRIAPLYRALGGWTADLTKLDKDVEARMRSVLTNT